MGQRLFFTPKHDIDNQYYEMYNKYVLTGTSCVIKGTI